MQTMNGFSGSMIVHCAYNFYLHSFHFEFCVMSRFGF
jgi:hypothetical protein